MLDPLDYDNRPYLDALSRKRRNAYFIVLTERISTHFWRMFFWILLFCGLWMLEIPHLFGSIGQIISSLVFFGGVAYFLKYDILNFHIPDSSSLDQRIEHRNNLLRGHISALEDKISNPKKTVTRLLWSYFEQQVLETFTKLKTPHPRALLSRQDPMALRFLAILFFVSGLSVAGSQSYTRIWDGMFSFAPSYTSSKAHKLSLWITPPEYTNTAQMYFSGRENQDGALRIPEDSIIKLRLEANIRGMFKPRFYNGDTIIKPEHLGDGIYGLETKIEQGTELAIKQLFFTRAKWPYELIKDAAPQISFSYPKEKKTESTLKDEPTQETKKEPPSEELDKSYEILAGNQLRFPLTLKDDYSVEDVTINMTLDPMVEDKPLGEDFSEKRLVMSPPDTEFKIDPTYDLSWHSWSGLPVNVTFEAKDHKGQVAQTPSLSFILPERKFEHPVARSLVAVRKILAWNYEDDFTPQATDLASLLNAPDFFNHDPVIFLAIQTASARLALVNEKSQNERTAAAKEIIKLLWVTAISVEDGDLALALSELRQAQKDLEQALADPDTTEQEMAQLMENLQEKMQNYFTEMQREMQKRMENGEQMPQIPPDQLSEIITPDVLSKMLEKLQSAMKSGDKSGAQEMLSQLQRMMDMMDPSNQMQLPLDMQMMSEGINELQELIEKQESLRDQTQDQADDMDGQLLAPSILPDLKTLEEMGLADLPPAPQETLPDNGATDEKTSQSHKAEQEGLRYILGQLMMDAGEKLEEIPENMGLAEQDMRGSENALEQNDPHSSVPHQESAIENLKQAQEQLSQQLASRMQMMVGVGPSAGQRYDPLGRPYGGQDQPNGQAHGSDVKIPDEAEKKRVEEILKLLRERSGEFDRPQDELEYFRRLLRQF